MLEDATWQALTLVLTLLGGGYTWYAAKHRGSAAAIRGAAITLLPPAAYLTGTLKLGGRVLDAVADWATALVFSPVVWLGITLFGVSALLFGVSGFLTSHGKGGGKPQVVAKAQPKALPPTQGRSAPAIDDDLAEIEAILKKRGIS